MSHPLPPPLDGPENDYRSVFGREPAREVTLAVVLPIYNRVSRLDATLAGLLAQTRRPDEVVVSDDGSDEDVAAVVDRYRSQLPISLVRRDREAFGAGQARNLGAASSTGDILVFLDSDCIPAPEFLERHEWWHQRASSLVVVGNRYHLAGDSVTPEMVGSSFSSVADLAENVPDSGAPDDWRGLFYRRNRRLQMGDAAFRAVVSSNMSVERSVFDEVGGFPSGFQAWGGEDTELGWRLWNAGVFVCVEDEAVVYHQLEPGETREGRSASLERSRMLIADRIPSRLYRRRPSPVALTPKVSWLVTVGGSSELEQVMDSLARGSFSDVELIVIGSGDAVEAAARVTENLRFRTAETATDAVRAAHGEFLFLLDGRMTPHPTLVERSVRRFALDPRVGAVRYAYHMKGMASYRRIADGLAIDKVNGRGTPLCALVRRREVMKDIRVVGSPDWNALFNRCRLDLLINDTVTGDPSSFDLDPPRGLALGFEEITRAGAEESARTIVRAVRARRGQTNGGPSASETAEATGSRTPIRYLGWTGHDNLGDEALLGAISSLLSWADIDPSESKPSLLMVGGGTLINSDGSYLRRFEQLDSPRLDRVVFGTGVRSPEYWGITEDLPRWWSIFESSVGVWVRGPHSEHHLREAGYTGSLEVVGDPALALTGPAGSVPVDGRVVVNPMHARGELWGRDDAVVLQTMAEVVRSLHAEGRDVVLMTAHPSDDRWAIEVMRSAGLPGLDFVPGYDDLDRTLSVLAEAQAVIAERLHVSVLAAAVGRPFVGIEYRPKVADFAASLGAQDRLIRSDGLSAGVVLERVAAVISDTEGTAAIDREVAAVRLRLAEAADLIHAKVSD